MTDIHDKIKAGKYDSPKRPQRPTSICINGHYFTTTRSDIPNFCSVCGVPVKERYEEEMNKYYKEMKEYNRRVVEIRKNFKKDALTSCGLINHPKAEKAFEMAWERGHSNGYTEVVYELEKLADFLDVDF